VDTYAAGNNLGSLNRSPRTIMAQAMRAILLASATAATLIGRRSIRRASQGRFVPCWRAYRMTAIAPATSRPPQWRLPRLEVPAESLFAPGRMLSRHQADPRCETAARRERLPISYLGHERGGDDRANTRDFLQPPAFFARAVPGVDTLLDRHDLCPDDRILASKDIEAEPRGRWNAIILLVSDDLEQLCRAIAALGRDNAQLGHMPTDRI